MLGLLKLFFFKYLYEPAMLYPTPVNLTYLWNFGALAGLALVLQIVTGLLLSLWYVASVDLAFASVEFIMREVTCGWLLRFLHANGASLFFIAVYVHMGRGIFYSSYAYPRDTLWYSGIIIFMLMIITAFFGYVLPWGQMSYWAATVITSLLSVVPIVGDQLLVFVWGGLSLDQPTLTRIYGLHFLLPFILIGVAFVHLLVLHEDGSTNVLGLANVDVIPFHPYYTYKDIVGVCVTLLFFSILVCKFPNLLSHSDNYILANPEVTPTHIVPEWYFLPFYGILRSVPSKAGGVFLLLFAIFALLVLPRLSKPLTRSGFGRPWYTPVFGVFVMDWFFLGWSGGNPIEPPYYEICQLATMFYFLFFFVINPGLVWLETYVYRKKLCTLSKLSTQAYTLEQK